ncbi:sporulation histidine kinase inhibitor Sda [Aneurinibacillus tyrosinisolvens]|nr:sporulation histidine kinase inhibitor Sda [Aneurinibacillus tyrosinisolvens]
MDKSSSLSLLSDEDLLSIYFEAKTLGLDDDFLKMIIDELKRRGIEPA